MDTVGRNKEMIAKYFRSQLQEEIMADLLSFKEFLDLFDLDKNSQSSKKPKA